MPILVMCTNPACGELFDAPDSSAGGEVHCPSCGTAQKLAAAPAAGPAPAAPPQATQPAAKAPPAPTPAPAAAPPPAKGMPATGATVGKPLSPLPPAAPEKDDVDLDVVDLAPNVEPRALPRSAPRHAPAGPSAPAGPKVPASQPDDEIVFEAKPTKGRAAEPPDKAPAPPGKPSGAPAAPGFAERGKAYLHDLRRELTPPPSAEEELEDSIWSAAPADDATGDADGADGAAPGDSVLGHRPAAALVFALGLVGMAAGLLAGVKLFPEQIWLAAYAGAGVGWMAGFTFGTLLILGAEQSGGKVRCPVCNAEYPAETAECSACGCQSLGPAPDPLAIECLHAGGFALSNPSAMLPPVALGVAGVLIVSGAVEVLHAYPQGAAQWTPFLIGACVLAGYLVFSYWMAYLLGAAHQPPSRVNLPKKSADAPPLASLETITAGFWGLAALAVYVAPLVTAGLLPVAMLLLGTPGKRRALDPLVCARAAWRRPKGFVVLWLFLMMWLAGAVLAGIVLKVIYDMRLSLPQVEGFAGVMLKVTLSAFAAGAFGIVASIFGLAIFRCIGAFGRYNASALPPPAPGSRAG